MNSPIFQLSKPSETNRLQQNARLWLCLLYGVMAQTYTNLFFKVTVDVGPARLNDLANFTAMRPYQYRVLIPALVHLLAKLTHADKYQVFPLYSGIEWISVFVSFWVFRAYLATFTDTATSSILTIFLLPAMLLMHEVCALGHYPYDTPQIVLFTLGLFAIRKQNWPLFYATFILAVFNRESSVLLIPAFGLTMLGTIPKPKLAAHIAVQAVIFAAIKISLDHVFASNPGDFTENHVLYNEILIGKLIHLNPFITSMAILQIGTAWLIYSGREYIPDFAKRLLWLFPLYVAVMWRVGVLDEIRAYNEMVPVLLVPILLIAYRTLTEIEASKTEITTATPDIQSPLQKAA